MIATQNAIYGIGRFSTVRVEPDQAAPRRRRSRSPRSRSDHERGLGGRRLRHRSAHVLGAPPRSYTRRGVLTPLTTLDLDARPEYASRPPHRGFIHCTRPPRIACSPSDAARSVVPRRQGRRRAGIDYLTVEAYTKARAHARVGLATPVGTRRLQLRIGWQYTYTDFVTVFIDERVRRQARRYRTTSARTPARSCSICATSRSSRGAALRRDARREGHAVRGQSFDYLQLTPEVRGFLSIGRSCSRRALDWVRSPATCRSPSDTTAGGMSSQRGFPQRGLSPLATEHRPDAPDLRSAARARRVEHRGADPARRAQGSRSRRGRVPRRRRRHVHGEPARSAEPARRGGGGPAPAHVDRPDRVDRRLSAQPDRAGRAVRRAPTGTSLFIAVVRQAFRSIDDAKAAPRSCAGIKPIALGLVALLLVIAIITVVFVLQTRCRPRDHPAPRGGRAREQLPGGAEIERIDGSVFGTLTIRNLELVGRDGKRQISSGRSRSASRCCR